MEIRSENKSQASTLGENKEKAAGSRRQLPVPVILIVAVGVLVIVLLLLLLLRATSISSNPAQAFPQAAPGKQSVPGQTNSNNNEDPYASLSARRVIETYMKARQAEDWETCKKLFSPLVVWDSPDSFALKTKAETKNDGKLTGYNNEDYYDHGDEIGFNVQPIYEQKPGPYYRFEVKKYGNAWKISKFYYI